MAGRRAKPINLLIFEKKKHLTKKEIEFRKKNEIRMGTPELKMPASVRANPTAKKKWGELVKLYKGVDFVSSSDVGVIGQLCLAYAELDSLLAHLNRLENIEPFEAADEEEIYELLGEDLSEIRIRSLLKKLNYLTSLGGILTVNKSIDQKRSLIRSLEDRLFLNPLAKIRSIPKKPEKEPEVPENQKKFANV